jgi:hypothetical protein
VAIGDDAANERQQENRKLSEEIVEAELERGLGQLEDEPALRHLLHPRADRRGKRAKPEDAKVAVGECRESAAQQS